MSDYDVFYYPMIVPASIAIAPGLRGLREKSDAIGACFLPILALAVGITIATDVRDRWDVMDVSDARRNSAAFFGVHALLHLPDKAVVIAASDGDAFALMYAVSCGVTDATDGERLLPKPGVQIVVANWVKYDWFREYVKDKMGDKRDDFVRVGESGTGTGASNFCEAEPGRPSGLCDTGCASDY